MTPDSDLPPFPWRVASIPADHPYVRALVRPGDRRLLVRPDPAPAVPDPQPGQWWPPRWLDPDWLAAHGLEVDLLHLHFGFDASPPDELRRWTELARRLGRPLVFTVHDLVNPHFADPARHLAQLDVLVPAATAVATLTPGAAAAIAARWGVVATVLPHPHLVPLDRPPRPARPAGPFVIGVHAKELRANLDVVPVLDALLAATTGRPEVTIRLDAHPGALAPATDPRRAELRDWVERHRDDPRVDVRVHPRLSDDELWDYLESLDLCVLPYRFGTHSGWLEACVDLGVPVLVPAVGFLAEQHGHPCFRHPRDAGPAELVGLVQRVLDDPAAARRTAPDRARAADVLADAHIRLYTGALRQARQHRSGGLSAG